MPFTHGDEPREYAELRDWAFKSEDALLLVDSAGKIVLANDAVTNLLGHPAGSLLDRCVEDFGRETMRAFQRVTLDAVIVNNIEVTVRDALVTHADGGQIPVGIVLTPMITERDTVVLVELREGSDRYRQMRLFKGLLETGPDGTVIVDVSGTIVLVNAQIERLFGYDRASWRSTIKILVPDRFSGMHMAFRNGYVSEPRTRPMGLAGDLFARRKDGSESPVEISLAPLETDQGLLVSAAVRDISERRRMQEATDRIKDEFFATVSHDCAPR